MGALLCVAAPASGQQVLVANLLYESPSLVAPAVLLVWSGADGRTWRAGLTGWTLAGEWSRRDSPARTVLASAWLTPMNANGSDRIYRDGTRVPELEYGNAAAGVGLGVRYHADPAWLSEIRLVGHYERVTGLPEATLDRWRRPLVGLEVGQTYQRVTAEDPLRSTLEGLRVQARLQAFAGPIAWGRMTATLDAGHALGRLLVRGGASYMFGYELDTVSAFLVGGSWDSPGLLALYGHPYAAFRVARGALLRGAVDVPLGGEWRLGFRAAHLASPDAVHSGGMVRVGTSLSGISAYVGAAAPDSAFNEGELGRALFIAGLSAAIFPE